MQLRGVPFILKFEVAARKDLEQFAVTDQLRVIDALESFAQTGIGQFKPLQSLKDVYRLRIGTMRAEFYVVWNEKELGIIRIFHRQTDYGKKARNRR